MPTEPIQDIAGREIQPQVKQLFAQWSKYIDEIVAFGSHILKWIGDSRKLGGDEEIPLIMTFRNVIELVDSIAILLRESSIDPCKLQLRAILESLLVIKFITEKDAKLRALNYLVCHYHQKLDLYKKLDSKTPQGKQFQTELKRGQYGSKMQFPNIPNLKKAIDNLENLLKKPHYVQSETEYQRLKKKKKGKPVWYEFFGGPKSIIELADYLNLIDMYNILYRQFSRSIHGQDVIDSKLSGDSRGYAAIAQIRHPQNAQTICQLTIGLSLNIYRSMIKHYIPEELGKYQDWYLREIEPFFNDISNKQLLEIKD